MTDRLPVWIVEPDPVDKWNHWSSKFSKVRTNPDALQESVDIDAVKRQLKEIRQRSKDNNKKLVDQLKESLSQRYPQITIKTASDSTQAISYIKEISAGINHISVNKLLFRIWQ